jgi:hypothetical protein
MHRMHMVMRKPFEKNQTAVLADTSRCLSLEGDAQEPIKMQMLPPLESNYRPMTVFVA